ncbi:MAG: Uma2 family endonuclease [Phycisphaerae bacterium]|nr:Uma2 family endonuclease [Phycisphaerae bacterium]NIU27923.1 Uma2 family endonuclease [candidate division KSB1 bacterium]NIP50861.1 Uma2 family endonuclease [Phycisphaerae bacterium]NIV02224.1 Uma2 family endonuclease [Phycisphaerae bacterium]NIV68860.1 Uma2 family endonuclease [Phycisphaerae bacterium]
METLVTSTTSKGQKFIPLDALWQVSITQYHAMIDSGALTEDNPIELLQGWLVQKMPKTPKHSTITRIIRKLLADLVTQGWYVDSQEPMTTADSEPEPDVMIIRGGEMDYLSQHPGPNDVALVVEVSDATLNRDKTLKKQLYAAAAVPVYWIVNIPDSQVEVYSQPFIGEGGPNYQQQKTYRQAEAVPVWIGETPIGEILVAQLFQSSN